MILLLWIYDMGLYAQIREKNCYRECKRRPEIAAVNHRCTRINTDENEESAKPKLLLHGETQRISGCAFDLANEVGGLFCKPFVS
jgi:hypothetical protein